MISKNSKIIIFSSIAILIIAFLLPELCLLSSTNTCAKAIEINQVKATKYLEYEFFVGKERKQSSRALRLFKIQDLDSLKKIECINIRYSTIWNSVTEVIDERIVK